MRQSRLKPGDRDIVYHTFNRVAGEPGYFPFGHVEKEKFVRLLTGLDLFYAVDVLAYQVMDNHFHLILFAPEQPPSPEETCRRYNAYYRGRRAKLRPDSPCCADFSERMRDVSWFMHDLQQQFASWFNRTRPKRRRGSLWADRFKHTILEGGRAVWECWKYIEMNPVRARMVADPAEYRFCSYGAWSATGRHPFAGHVEEHLLPYLQHTLQEDKLTGIGELLRQAFARMTAIERSQSSAEAEAALKQAGKPIPFTTQTDRRVRYWVDGLVIGSELFIRDIMLKARGSEAMNKRRLTYATEAVTGPERLASFKRLRMLPT